MYMWHRMQSREAFKCKGEHYNYTNENSEPTLEDNLGTLERWNGTVGCSSS